MSKHKISILSRITATTLAACLVVLTQTPVAGQPPSANQVTSPSTEPVEFSETSVSTGTRITASIRYGQLAAAIGETGTIAQSDINTITWIWSRQPCDTNDTGKPLYYTSGYEKSKPIHAAGLRVGDMFFKNGVYVAATYEDVRDAYPGALLLDVLDNHQGSRGVLTNAVHYVPISTDQCLSVIAGFTIDPGDNNICDNLARGREGICMALFGYILGVGNGLVYKIDQYNFENLLFGSTVESITSRPRSTPTTTTTTSGRTPQNSSPRPFVPPPSRSTPTPTTTTTKTLSCPTSQTTTAEDLQFTDIAAAGKHACAVRQLVALGYLEGTGCESNKLCPNERITRWQVGVWIARALYEGNPSAPAEYRFTDMPNRLWWANHVEYLAVERVTLGCATNPLRYCPASYVRRGQAASFIARAYDLEAAEPVGYIDTEESVHYDNINALHNALATSDTVIPCTTSPELAYCPGNTISKAEMATLLYRAILHSRQ